MDITPDLSHLTNDEKKIIEAVIRRQKAVILLLSQLNRTFAT